MSRSTHKDDKERYLTYSITVRAANKDKGIEEEVVTKKMPKFIDGGPKDFLDWVYHFDQLASQALERRRQILNTTILLEGDLREAAPGRLQRKLQEELWEIRKPRTESLAEYSKRFRALVRMEHTLARLNENSPMCEDALCRLYKRGLPYDWQNKYDASGQVYTTVAALVPFFERIEQGEQRLHRAGSQDKGSRHDNSRGHGRRNNNNNSNSTSYRNGNNSNSNNRQQHQRGRNPGRGNGNNNSHASSNKYCTFHRTTTHNTADCRALRHDNQQEEHQQADQRRGPRAAQPPQQHQQTRVVQRQTEGSSSDDEYLFVGLNASPTSSPPPMRVMIKLEAGKDRFQALLDSGCSRSIVSSAFMELLQQKQGATLEHSQVSFKLVKGNTKAPGLRQPRFNGRSRTRDRLQERPHHVGRKRARRSHHGAWPAAQDNANDDATLDEDDELCAGDDCATTPEDLLPQHLEAALEHCYLKLLEEYVDLYSGRLGRIRLDDYLLPLRADYTPSHARPYSVPRSQEEAAHREIQKLLEEDVIEQIYGSEAAAPAFFLVKPNGSLRLLVDFRELNKFLRRSPYYVPKIREILLRLGKAKCMSTLDANMGYFARRLARQSRAATAFCLPFGKFQFKRLPMGISTAPDEYQACMERILGDLDFVIVYLDDILIFSENPVEHLEHLRIVFDRLRQYDVTLNGKKCHICAIVWTTSASHSLPKEFNRRRRRWKRYSRSPNLATSASCADSWG
ncbi:Pol Polyprotein [Phytophthora cinnamomi]|uniref:Pol Polyprotein n=1 Tax=Phytophthora cinnamomi TaxID=4785 RepID=UPI0035595E1B|nr:Pol Polyprotein [Phytophthora cinnamomi]